MGGGSSRTVRGLLQALGHTHTESCMRLRAHTLLNDPCKNLIDRFERAILVYDGKVMERSTSVLAFQIPASLRLPVLHRIRRSLAWSPFYFLAKASIEASILDGELVTAVNWTPSQYIVGRLAVVSTLGGFFLPFDSLSARLAASSIVSVVILAICSFLAGSHIRKWIGQIMHEFRDDFTASSAKME